MENLKAELLKRKPRQIMVMGENSQEKLLLDFNIIEMAFNSILRLMPAEFRKPPALVDELYKQKIAIKEFVEAELKAEEEILEQVIKDNANTTVSDNEG